MQVVASSSALHASEGMLEAVEYAEHLLAPGRVDAGQGCLAGRAGGATIRPAPGIDVAGAVEPVNE
eukprot:9349868-Alexandrium_andersonii.AAC.1